MRKTQAIFFTLTAALCLTGCSPAFQWDDLSTWGPESKRDRYYRELAESCGTVGSFEHNRRVVHINGVDETYYHTECIPETQAPPQQMNRMEGR